MTGHLRNIASILLLALAVGCGGGTTAPAEDAADRPDAAGDVAARDVAEADAPDDVAPDTAPDAVPDTAPDTRVDVPADVLRDTAPVPDDARDDAPADGGAAAPDSGDSDDSGDSGGAETLDGATACEFACCGDDDCDDRNACTVDRCSDHVCAHAFDLCDDENECTLDSCNVQTGCDHLALPGCCPLTLQWQQGFETGDAAGFEVSDLARNTRPETDPLDRPVVWNVTTHRARSGAYSLYGGDPTTFRYDNGRWVSSRAVSPPFPLDAERPSALVFWVFLGVEAGTGIDTLNVGVETEVGFVPLWAKDAWVPLRDWHRVSVDLSAFRGQTVRFVFHFDTMDGRYNDYEGIYIDDLAVGLACAAPTCGTDADCDDGNSCTLESCGAEGRCDFAAYPGCCVNPADCRDGDACTLDACHDGACRWLPDPLGDCCDLDTECDDGDRCTADSCHDHRCRHVPSGEPRCCAADADCATLDPCFAGVCDDEGACRTERVCCESDAECADPNDLCVIGRCQTSGACDIAPSGQPGCCEREVFTADFDTGGLADFALENEDASVGWTLHGGVGTQSETPALYYGRPSAGDYDSGSRNRGTARTRPITLPTAVETRLEFRMLLDVEPGATHDTLRVDVRVRDIRLTIWEKTPQTPMLTWFDVGVDVSAFGGEAIQFEWEFDTRDAEGNDRGGVYVDDVVLRSTCAQRTCSADSACADTFAATEAWCGERSTCQYRVIDGFCETDEHCDDEEICTADACVGGICTHEAVPDCCHQGPDCEDDDVCTVDACLPGPPPTCRHTRTPGCCVTDADCDDANRCTADTCPGSGGACVREWIVDCCLSSLDCDDGDACTDDRCVGGLCANLPVCCEADADCDDGDDVCTTEHCGADQRCVFEPTDAAGCCDGEILAARWDGLDPVGFTFANPQPQYGWFLVEDGPAGVTPGVEPPYLYFGDPRDYHSYGHGTVGANSAAALSDWLDLPPDVEVTLTFDLWMNTEVSFDTFAVVAEFNGRSFPLFETDRPARAWETIAVDLSFAAGEPLRFGFRFEADETIFSGDTTIAWQGVFVDHVEVRTTCGRQACGGDGDCAVVDCVGATCVDGGCVYEVPPFCCDDAAACNDDNPCTNDACVSHRCVFEPSEASGCCLGAEDCADEDPCTDEGCFAHQCWLTFTAGCTPLAPYCQGFGGAAAIGALGFESTVAPGGQPRGWEVGAIGGTGLDGPHLSFDGDLTLTDFEQCVLTPVLDGSALGAAATLRFRQNVVPNEGGGDATLSARSSADGGTSWDEVWGYAVSDTTAPLEEVTITLPEGTAGAPSVRLALCVSGSTAAGLSRWNVDDLCLLAGGAPTFEPLEDVTMEIGVLIDVPVVTHDPDGGAVVLSLAYGPPFLFLADHGDGTGTISLAPDIADKGEYDVVVRAADDSFHVETAFHLSVLVPGEVVAFVEDFEAADAASGFDAIGWEERPANANWTVWAEGDPTAGVVARFEDTPAVRDFDHRLVSPIFDASSLGQVSVRWIDVFDYGCCDALYLTLDGSRDGGATWTELWRYAGHVDEDYAYGERSIDASAVLGGARDARIAFRAHGDDTYDINFWEIDRVEVSGVDVGVAPTWDPLPTLLAPVGARTPFPLSATDPDSAELTFLPGGDTPSFVSIENDGPRSATLVVHPAPGDAGVYAFQLRVTDGFHPVPQPAELTVFVSGAAPVVAPVGRPVVVVGEVLKVDLLATDPDGQPLTWHVGPALPGFASLRDHGSGRATLTLVPTLADVGEHVALLRVDDTTQIVDLVVPIDVVFPGGTPLLGEDFEAATSLAALGWTTASDPGSPANDWFLATAAGGSGALGGTGRARFADFPQVVDFEDRLVSPPFDTSEASAVTVRFQTVFQSYRPEDAAPPVEIALLGSTDGGATWVPLWSHVETDGDLAAGPVEVGPTAALAGVPDARVAFQVSGGDSATILYWDVDDVTVAAE